MLTNKQHNALLDFLQFTFYGMVFSWFLPKWCVIVYGLVIVAYLLFSIVQILFLERKGTDV